MLLPYEKIFSRSRGLIDDPKELSLDINDQIEINTERLHNVVGDPRVRRIFSSITFGISIKPTTGILEIIVFIRLSSVKYIILTSTSDFVNTLL